MDGNDGRPDLVRRWPCMRHALHPQPPRVRATRARGASSGFSHAPLALRARTRALCTRRGACEGDTGFTAPCMREILRGADSRPQLRRQQPNPRAARWQKGDVMSANPATSQCRCSHACAQVH